MTLDIPVIGRVFVSWKHIRRGENAALDCEKTICEVTTADKTMLYRGVAECGRFTKEKAFSKDKGRKVSLAKALKPVDASIRAEFWREYFKMTHQTFMG